MQTVVFANNLERTVTGPMWHGPALDPLLDGVTHDQAAARPIPDAHTIWELVLHIAVWAEIARARLRGERLGDPTPQEDWPPPAAGEAAWRSAVTRLREAYRLLAEDVRVLDEARLDEKVRELDYTVSILLHGVIEHGTYHGGQIALLRKSFAGAPRG